MATNHRKQYRQVTTRVSKAKACLVEALAIVRAEGLRYAARLERHIASTDALQTKFEKLSNGEH